MRSFAAFVLLLIGSLLVAALVTYPAWLLVGLIADQPIHRVMHRIAMLIALFGFIYLVRRLGMANKPALGFGLPRAEFIRQLLIGLGIGIVIILPLAILLLALGVRVPKPELQLTVMTLLKFAAAGLATGLTVALIEEIFFRGALFSAIRRESGLVLAIVLPSLLYASVHFLGGRLRVPAESIDWGSGLTVLAKTLEKYAQPASLVDSFAALFCVGALLSLARLHTGAIAASIGLHAAWVCVITVLHKTTRLDAASNAGWLVGSYDGVIGWGAMGYMLIIGLVYLAIALKGWPTGQPANWTAGRIGNGK